MEKYLEQKLDIVLRHFFSNNYYDETRYVSIVSNIVERMLDNDYDEDEYDKVYSALNDSLIYYEDQWIVLRYHFIDPKEANFDEAIEYLIENCIEVYNELKGRN